MGRQAEIKGSHKSRDDSLFLLTMTFRMLIDFLGYEQETGAVVIVTKGRKTKQLRNRQIQAAKQDHAQWSVEV